MRPVGRVRTAACAAFVLATAAQAQSEAPELKPYPPALTGQTDAPRPATPTALDIELMASGLDHPMSFAFLPDGGVLVAELSGALRIVAPGGAVSEPIAGMPDVRTVGSHGLNDVLLAPDFADSRTLYFSYFAPPRGEPGGAAPDAELSTAMGTGRVARARLSEDYSRLTKVDVIADGVDGRLAFGPDERLYAAGSDRYWEYGFDEDGLDQEVTDFSTLATYTGRVLRMTPRGRTPRDNPWTDDDGVPDDTFSYGHRDPQGMIFHPETGELWLVEQGPVGGDELNVVRSGGNYGWPNYSYGHQADGAPVGTGRQSRSGVDEPIYYWRTSIAPRGMLFYTGDLFPQWQGDLFVGATAGSGFLARLEIEDGWVAEEEHMFNGHGQVSDVRQAPDGTIWVLTREGSLMRVGPGLLGAGWDLQLAMDPRPLPPIALPPDPELVAEAAADASELAAADAALAGDDGMAAQTELALVDVDAMPVAVPADAGEDEPQAVSVGSTKTAPVAPPRATPAAVKPVRAAVAEEEEAAPFVPQPDPTDVGPILTPVNVEVTPLNRPPETAVVHEASLPPVAATQQSRKKSGSQSAQ